VVPLVGPIDVLAVDGDPARQDGGGDERLIDVTPVEVGAADRAVRVLGGGDDVVVGPVDVGAVDS
jgi:hypothetical protein